MLTFIGGVARLGAARASIVSALQPALTPLVAFAVFANRLGLGQAAGGVLVIASVVVLEAERNPPLWLADLPRRERWLIRMARRLDLPSGSQIIRQGAPAAAFYLIERGRVTVTRDGRRVADLGPGDFFGEVALMQDTARTASVAAATDVRVRFVPRHRFPRAMRMLPTLASAVDSAMRERTSTSATPEFAPAT
jgi:hypothetical protein